MSSFSPAPAWATRTASASQASSAGSYPTKGLPVMFTQETLAATILVAGVVAAFAVLHRRCRPTRPGPKHAGPKRAARRPAFADDHLQAFPGDRAAIDRSIATIEAAAPPVPRPPLTPAARRRILKAIRVWGAR